MNWFIHNKKWQVRTIVIVGGFLLINVISYLHAYKFTHFIEDRTRTRSPELLSQYEKIKILFTGVSLPKPINTHTPEEYDIAYNTRTITSQQGLETIVWEIMSPHAHHVIILFHGYSSNKGDLLPLADALRHYQANIILVDFPGHGDSSYNWTTLGHKEADIVNAVYTYYQQHSPVVPILCGTSLGASAILAAVHRYQITPKGLILEMPYGSLYQTTKSRFHLMGFPISFPFAELLVFWGSVQCGYNAFTFNPVEYARDVTVPTLLMGGERDQRVPPAMLNEVYQHIVSQKKMLHVFHGAGHESLFHASPQEYRQNILTFLQYIE
ncbi:lysophospholipase-like protein [Candidatus Moduliflexus flocculans]|uniref:Lysophospholipase-like protein n=1 Tax=Candidatus Moduliflexus flocculans TaxID=1499966 RepID=A0A081BNY9_9BACT|nr:lysophospholipase-like protein [Candidatus Moduliflexus flocculans]